MENDGFFVAESIEPLGGPTTRPITPNTGGMMITTAQPKASVWDNIMGAVDDVTSNELVSQYIGGKIKQGPSGADSTETRETTEGNPDDQPGGTILQASTDMMRQNQQMMMLAGGGVLILLVGVAIFAGRK